MVKSTKQMLGAVIAVPVFGMVMIGSAAAAPETCNWKTARNLANAGDYAGLCDCVQVTPSFLNRLQKRSDFEATLSVTGAQCPGLAALLTDLPTASLSGSAENRGESRGSEPGGSGFADAGSAPGGESGGGGDTGGGGGNSGGGGGESGGGGGESGDGGGESGGGGGESGGGESGGGESGGGESGGGESGGGEGKGGKGNGGKGGGKGNNGHGNGGEGSSPGRGNNANDDEGGDRPGRGGGKDRR